MPTSWAAVPALFTMLAVLTPGAAAAQQTGSSGTAASAADSATAKAPARVSQPELRRFVAAYARVQAAAGRMQTQLAKASNDRERQQVRTRANQQIAAALKANDLTPKEYTRVLEAVKSDATLNAEFSIMMDQQKDSAGG
jgi:Domain of unknown function (DUF4168)